MVKLNLKTWIKIVVLLAGLSLAFAAFWFSEKTGIKWQSQVTPGELSAAHASLKTNCAACHTTGQGFGAGGIDSASCISCHANNQALLQRQPTAFHANLTTNCNSCHVEHQGADANLRVMNHDALVQISENLTVKSDSANADSADVSSNSADGNPLISPREATLNCASCHSSQDKHQGLMGINCASCHATSQWTIPQFQHPSPNTVNCAQCHQAPPSHNMMHFEMMDKKITGQENAQVQSCYVCHQTNSWNDIKGVGFFKMH